MRFQCLPGCTRCCEQKGYVYLSEADLVRLAKFTSDTKRSFESKYVIRTTNTLRFRKPRGKQCPFLQTDGCAIHPAKPTQCRTFPFWPELLENKQELREATRYCPGLGKGELVNIECAQSEAEAMREALPYQYR